jgi:hypothetical protein
MPIAKPLLRLNRPCAELVPPELHVEWHAQAIQMPGFTEVDRKVLDAVAAWYRGRQAKGWASPIAISAAIKRLVSLPQPPRPGGAPGTEHWRSRRRAGRWAEA